MVLVWVKWGKEKYEVDICPEESPLLFKSQLFTLTNVVPERQKLLAKGRTIGDENWEGLDITPGMMFMMMGSSAPIPQLPSEVAVAKADIESRPAVVLPLGLANLGNTCYFNSVVQSLQVVRELHKCLGGARGTDKLIQELYTVFRTVNDMMLAEDETYCNPLALLSELRAAFPQFNSISRAGHEQQDANECFTLLLDKIFRATDGTPNAVRKYFEGRFQVKTTCIESPELPPVIQTETFNQLSCFLNQEVKYIQTGIKNGLNEEIEKFNPSLNRNSMWMKQELIERLPKYFSVQLVRFFYKGGDAQTSAKILKDVKFPMVLDMYDMCTPELQAKLQPMRATLKEEEDAKIEFDRHLKTLHKADEVRLSKQRDPIRNEFLDDIGSNNTGFYELKAVVSHKGRTVKSGHYVAWVKEDGKWMLCDDENVTIVDSENVLRTSGGGDWHTAYILLYGARDVYRYPRIPKEDL